MAKNEIQLTYKLVNSSFNAGITEMNKQTNSLNKGFKAQAEQMRLTATDSEKLTSKLGNLNDQYVIAQQKTRLVESGLNNVKELFGENSKEAQVWSNKLADAQKNEAYLGNAITETTGQLNKAKAAEAANTAEVQKAAQASDKRKASLKQLSSEQEHLTAQSDKTRKQYELEVAALGNDAKASDKAKLSKKYYADQLVATSKQVDNLDKQLSIAKTEYGENSKEVDKLEKQLLEAKKAHQDFANSLDGVSNKLRNMGDSMQKAGSKLTSAGSVLTKGLTMPIVLGVGASVKAASDFQSSFADVRKTVDQAVDSNGKVTISYDDLEKSIRNLATKVPASTDEINELAASAGQLGIKTKNVMGFTKTMLEMGVATNMTSNDAGVALAKLANITQMPQKNFDRLGSSIVNLGNNMATTEADIVEMSLRLGGTGHLVGMTEPQITGLAAAMSSLGINAEAGGGSMSRVLQKMNSAVLGGGKKLTAFAKVSNVSAADFVKAWKKDPAEAINLFTHGLNNANESGKDVTGMLKAMGISSTQEIDTLLRLAGGNDTLSKSLKVSEDGWRKNTALTSEAEKRYGTFQSKLKILQNKVKDIAIEFGGPFLDAVSGLLDALQPLLNMLKKVAEKFSSLSPAGKKMAIAITAVLAAVGPLLLGFGKILTAAGSVSKFFGGPLGKSILGIVSKFAPVIGVISLVIGAFVLAYNKISWFKDGVDRIAKTFKTTWDYISGLFTMKDPAENIKIGKNLAKLLPQSVVDGIRDSTVKVRGFFQDMGEAIKAVVDIVTGKIDSMDGLTAKFGDFFNDGQLQAIKTIGDGIKGAFDKIKLVAGKMGDILKNAFGDFVEKNGPAIQKAVENIQKVFGGLGNFIKGHIVPILAVVFAPLLAGIYQAYNVIRAVINNIADVFQGIVDVISGVFEVIVGIFALDGGTIKSGISDIFKGAVEIVKGIWDTLVDVVTGPFKDLWNLIGPSVTSFADSVSQGFGNVVQGIKDTWSGITQWFSDLWQSIVDTVSPVFETIGNIVQVGFMTVQSIVQGVWLVITSLFQAGWNILKSVFKFISDGFTLLWNGLLAFITPILTNIWTFITTTFNNIVTGIQTVMAPVVQFFITLWTNISTATSTVWNAVVLFLSGVWTNISTTIQSVWNSVTTFLTTVWTNISTAVHNIITPIVAFLSGVWTSISNTARSVWNSVSSFLSGLWHGVSSTATSVFSSVKTFISNIWNGIKSVTSSVWNGIKSTISTVWTGIKSGVSSAINGVKTTVSNVWDGIKTTTTRVWNGIKSAIMTPINAAKSAVKTAIDKIKGFFSGLHLKLPKISMPALPHFKLTGKFSLKPPSVPHLGVSWYAKGGLMTRPTLFGMNGSNAMVGGEAGKEAILPLTKNVLSDIGAGIVAATKSISEIYNNATTTTVNFYNTITNPQAADAVFEKADKWIADKGMIKNFGVTGKGM